MTRTVPSASKPGVVNRYALTMRVAGDGTLEVGKVTTTLRHIPGTASAFAASPPVFRQMLACEPAPP